MPYIDVEGLEARFTRQRVAEVFGSADVDGSFTGAADPAAFAACEADARAELEEILAPAYVTPFDGPPYERVPPAVVELAAICTMWRGVQTRRPEYLTDERGKVYAALHALAMKRLDELRDRRRKLSDAIVAETSGGRILTSDPPAIAPSYFRPNPFTGEGGLEGF